MVSYYSKHMKRLERIVFSYLRALQGEIIILRMVLSPVSFSVHFQQQEVRKFYMHKLSDKSVIVLSTISLMDRNTYGILTCLIKLSNLLFMDNPLYSSFKLDIGSPLLRIAEWWPTLAAWIGML